MEIIKRGISLGDRIYTGTCFMCTAQVKFKQREAKHVSDQRDGDYCYVTCPTEGCGRMIFGKLVDSL